MDTRPYYLQALFTRSLIKGGTERVVAGSLIIDWQDHGAPNWITLGADIFGAGKDSSLDLFHTVVHPIEVDDSIVAQKPVALGSRSKLWIIRS